MKADFHGHCAPIDQADVNLVWFCERRCRKVDVESAERHHGEDVVTRYDASAFPKQIAQSDLRVGGEVCPHMFQGCGVG